MSQKKRKLNDREILDRILTLLESGDSSPTSKFRVYNNKQVMEMLSIKDEFLKKLRDNGYLAYSRYSDKYWYTQEDLERFLRRFHFADFAKSDKLPNTY